MNTQRSVIATACSAILVACALATPAARAQNRQSLAQAEIPFAFHYGKRVFPAGTYHLGMVTDYVLCIRGGSNSALAMVQWDESTKQPAQGELVFRRVGGNYTLEDVWVPTLSAHISVLKGKTERRREFAQLTPAAGYVEVALAEAPR